MTAIPSSGYGSLMNDPCWQAYLQSQAQQKMVQPQDNTQIALPPNPSTIAMKGNVERASIVEEEGSGALSKVLWTAGVLGVGAAACIISKGKSGTSWFGKERWSTGWNAIKSDWFGIGKKAVENATNKVDDLTTRTITSRKVGENWVVSLPNKQQTLKGPEAITKANSLGININQNVAWTDTATNLEKACIHYKHNGQEYKAFFENGNISKVLGEDGKTATVTEALEQEHKKILEAIGKKKLPEGVTLSNVRYNTMENGTKIAYQSDYAKTSKNGIKEITTNRFSASDDVVQAYADDNAKFSKTLKEITDKKSNTEGWSIGSAIYSPKGLPENTEVVIREGAVFGVNAPNKYGKIEFFGLDTEKFKALHNQYTNLFDDAMKNRNKFQNVVYSYPF